MEEYKSNSHKSKENNLTEPKRKATKAITGTAKTKKKSEISKFADVFLAEDISSVKSYILMDVLVPAIKDGIVDIVKNGIDALMYGSDGAPSSKKSISSKISYTPYYKMASASTQSKEHLALRPKTAYEYDEVVLSSRGEAEMLLKSMDEAVREYGMVSIGDYYDMAGVTSEYTTNRYGWTDLREATISRNRDGYMIKLPKPTPLT